MIDSEAGSRFMRANYPEDRLAVVFIHKKSGFTNRRIE